MKCPNCASLDIKKNGSYQTKYAEIQKYKCRNCGHFFINNPNKYKKKPGIEDKIIEFHKEGLSRKNIKEALSISKRTVDIAISKFSMIKDFRLRGYNLIIYGPPGVGKSYSIGERIAKKEEYKNPSKQLIENINSLKDENTKDRIIRATFHPEYSYGDFVGSIKPQIEKDSPKFKFIRGKFLKAIDIANENMDKYVYLIIEEMNRGNCASIFGEVFQLLDRGQDGESQYPVQILTADDLETVKIPRNLIIFATINTSDNSLYPIDSAFKRRWDMEYMSKEKTNNEHGYEKKSIKNKVYDYIFNDVLKNHRSDIFKGNNGEPLRFSEFYMKKPVEINEMILSFLKIKQKNKEKLTWKIFRDNLNKVIFMVTGKEDKEIGPYFLKEITDEELI